MWNLCEGEHICRLSPSTLSPTKYSRPLFRAWKSSVRMLGVRTCKWQLYIFGSRRPFLSHEVYSGARIQHAMPTKTLSGGCRM